MKVTAIVCTHNPRTDYLRRTLDSLQKQTLSLESWELFLIDNASRQPLADLVDIGWHPNGKIVREERLGLTHARTRGIAESNGGLIVFIDDDNILEADYLEESLRIASDWPQLGIWGGSIAPEYEVAPPSQVKSALRLLAVRIVTDPRWSNVWHCGDSEPYGAGLCIRKSVAEAYRKSHETSAMRIADRTGEALLSGGDTDMACFVCSLGLGMGVFPSLKVLHLIPKQRLTESYLARITHGINTSSMLIAFKWGGIVPRSPFSPIVIARFVKQIIFSRGFSRRQAFASYRALITAGRLIAKSKTGMPHDSAS